MPLTIDQVAHIAISFLAGMVFLALFIFAYAERRLRNLNQGHWISKPTQGGWWWYYGELRGGLYSRDVRMMAVSELSSGKWVAFCPTLNLEFELSESDSDLWMLASIKPLPPQ